MLTNKELYQLKWLLGLVLTGLSLWALCSLDFKSEVHLLVAFVILAFAFISPSHVAGIPSKVWRPLGAGVFLLIAVDFALHLPDFMPPLLRMVISLLIYRVLAPRARRDDLQLLLLGLFCLVISGVLTLSLLFAVQILLFAPIAMGLLFLISWLDRGPESRSVVPELEGLKVLPLLRRVVRILNLKVLLLGGVMFAFVVAVSTLLFVLTPRFNLDQSLPFLQISGQARAGFSDEVGLCAVSEIISDDSVALRIDVPSKEAVVAAPYWRVLVLDEYQAGGFLMSTGLKERPFRLFQQKRELMGATMAVESGQVLERKGALWTFYWEGGMSQYLPLPGAFHLLRFEGLQDIELISDLHVLGLDAVKQRVFSYQVEDLVFSERFPASASEKQAFVNPGEAPGDAYPWTTLKLAVSEAELERLKVMNRSITGGGSGASRVGIFSGGAAVFVAEL